MHRSRSLVLALAVGAVLLLVLARNSAVPRPAVGSDPERVAAAPLLESTSSSSIVAPAAAHDATESAEPAARERAVVPESERATLHVEVRGAPHSEDEWLWVTVFDVSGTSAAPEPEEVERLLALREAHQAKPVFAKDLATPLGDAEVSCPVPAERELVAVVHRDVPSFLPSNAVVPQLSERVKLRVGEEKRIVLDFGTKMSIAGHLVGVACLAKEVAIWESSMTGLRLRFEVRANPEPDGTLTMIGAAPGSYSFSAHGGDFPEQGAPLADATTGKRCLDLAGNAFLALRLADTHGELRMARNGVVVPVWFRWGEGPSMLARAVGPQLVSLPDLRRLGATKLWFCTKAEGLFSRDLDQLHHQENGDVLVELPDQHPACVEIVCPDVKEPKLWRVLACATVGDVRGMTADRRDDGWVLDGLPAGTYDLFWLRMDSRWNCIAPIARGMRVDPGGRYRLESDLPAFRATRITIRNWDDLPETLRPNSVWIGEVDAHVTETPGVFEADLAPPLERYGVARLHIQHVGGDITAPIAVVEDGVVVDCPRVDTSVVRVIPRFGGEISLSCFTRRSWVTSGLVSWLAFHVKPQLDGSFLVYREAEDPVVCAVLERDPISKVNVFRGFASISGSDRDVVVNPEGRWVALEHARPGLTIVHALTMQGDHELAFSLEPVGERETRFWLPDSASAIRVHKNDETATLATSSIGSTLRL